MEKAKYNSQKPSTFSKWVFTKLESSTIQIMQNGDDRNYADC